MRYFKAFCTFTTFHVPAVECMKSKLYYGCLHTLQCYEPWLYNLVNVLHATQFSDCQNWFHVCISTSLLHLDYLTKRYVVVSNLKVYMQLHCAMCTAYCTMWSVQFTCKVCAQCRIQCPMCIVKCTVYKCAEKKFSVKCAHNLQCILNSTLCNVNSEQCTI